MHIRAAFQIFKEMLNNTEAKNAQSSGKNVKPDMGDLGIVESTGMKTLQARVNDLQYQVRTSNLTHFIIFPQWYIWLGRGRGGKIHMANYHITRLTSPFLHMNSLQGYILPLKKQNNSN